MKTARETALELIHKHNDAIDDTDVIWTNILYKWILAKRCALISANQMLEVRGDDDCGANERQQEYWKVIEVIKKQ